jgi:hypothetical protein
MDLKKWFVIAFCLSLEWCFGQNFITNPGFEGPDGIEQIPADWFAGCGVMNTPDTQPGWWNIENKPYEGKSFINLLYKEDGTTESVYQKLAVPLDSGACYLIEIHLAQACQDSLSGLDPYDLNHPGDLRIRFSESYQCDSGQTGALFVQISHCNWKKYYAVFQANADHQYVYLEFFKGTSDFNNGSVLIDQFNLENLHPLPEQTLNYEYQDVAAFCASAEGLNHTWIVDGTTVAADTACFELLALQDAKVELTYYSADGCLISEDFMLLVKPRIPNVITPLDQNGINDVFVLVGLIESAQLTVFNRWGLVVYETDPYLNDWSPTQLNPGVYYYHLNFYNTGRIYTGMITIL